MKKYIFYLGLTSPKGLPQTVIREAYRIRLNSAFDGYTVIDAEGYWLGKSEPSLVVVVWSDIQITTARIVAEALRDDGAQQCVGLEHTYQGDLVLEFI